MPNFIKPLQNKKYQHSQIVKVEKPYLVSPNEPNLVERIDWAPNMICQLRHIQAILESEIDVASILLQKDNLNDKGYQSWLMLENKNTNLNEYPQDKEYQIRQKAEFNHQVSLHFQLREILEADDILTKSIMGKPHQIQEYDNYIDYQILRISEKLRLADNSNGINWANIIKVIIDPFSVKLFKYINKLEVEAKNKNEYVFWRFSSKGLKGDLDKNNIANFYENYKADTANEEAKAKANDTEPLIKTPNFPHSFADSFLSGLLFDGIDGSDQGACVFYRYYHIKSKLEDIEKNQLPLIKKELEYKLQERFPNISDDEMQQKVAKGIKNTLYSNLYYMSKDLTYLQQLIEANKIYIDTENTITNGLAAYGEFFHPRTEVQSFNEVQIVNINDFMPALYAESYNNHYVE